MLHFLRKHQKYFFIFITISIIVSFVFFGTYQAFAPTGPKEEKALETMDGKTVHRSSLKQLVKFLGEEGVADGSTRALLLGNFLNDGVISKDFLETGMGTLLYAAYAPVFQEDLQKHLAKEKAYTPYVHPHAAFLSQDTLWSLFAPELSEKLKALQNAKEFGSTEAFASRADLYLAERRFPAAMSAQVFRYQEREYNLPTDPRLYRDDLALFGYKDLTDWFGPHYVEGVAQVILNSAAYARTLGYKVSREEALSDLLVKSEKVFALVKDRKDCPFASRDALLAAYLARNGLTRESMVSLWQEVLLFRRLFDDVGQSAVLDTLPMKQYFRSAQEYVTIELTEMSEEYRLHNLDDLKLFEAYLTAACGTRKDLLSLPTAFESVGVVEKRAPEIVGTRYVLEVGKLSLRSLISKVTLKETWDYEVKHENWEHIKAKWPQLAGKKDTLPQERRALLDTLSAKVRTQVDEYAAMEIVKQHPEWVSEALVQVIYEDKPLFVKSKGTNVAGLGLTKGDEFVAALLKEKSLASYTEDGETYYAVRIKEEGDHKVILSFAEVKKEGLLKDKVTDCADVLAAMHDYAKQTKLISEAVAEKDLGERMPAYRFASFLASGVPADSIWRVSKKEKTISRIEPGLVSLEEALSVTGTSAVKVSKEGAYFFNVVDKKVDTTLPTNTMLQAQALVSKEIKRHFLEDVLKQMADKGGIVFSKDDHVL